MERRVQLPLIALAFCLQLVYIPSKRTSGADWRVKLRSIDHGGCFLSLAFTLLLLVGLLRGGSEVSRNIRHYEGVQPEVTNRLRGVVRKC